MRKTFLLALLLLAACGMAAQDSIRAVNSFSNKLVNGSITGKKFLIDQKTYDLTGRLLLLIRYADTVAKIESYTRYFYADSSDRLLSEETFNLKREVSEVKRYHYNDAGQLMEIRIYAPGKDRMQNIQTEKFQYTDGLLTGKTVLGATGKWQEKQVTARQDSIETTLIKYHKKNPEQLKTETITRIYRNGKLVSKNSQKLYRDKHQLTREVNFNYSAKGDVSDKFIRIDGLLTEHINYNWYSDGRLNLIKHYDPDEQLTKFISHSFVERVVTFTEETMLDLSKPLSQ
ncbi:MAG: hypothetical protein JW801_05790 [Bacteroidales bacterium]|nr:hypothetical protein [Bacteroidales bacterium]